MKKLKTRWVCALAMLAAACGGGQSHELPGPSSGAEQDPSKVQVAPADTRMELRLLGMQGGSASALLVGVRDIRVTYAGRELPVDVEKATLDLSKSQREWLAGTFHVPRGADRVQVTLYLDDYGGFEDAEGSGEIDARGRPISFEAPVKSLAVHERAVVRLDLARSLVDEGEGRKVLLPQYGVSY